MSELRPAKRNEPHHTPYISGCYCDNCRYMSCIRQQYVTDPLHYFCETLHDHLGLEGVKAMDSESCPCGDEDGKWLA